MGKIISAISANGSAVCYAINSTDIVAEAEKIHKTSAVVTAALGRLLTAASLMGCQLKGEDDSITLKLKGGGPAGTVMAVSDSSGNPRGCVQNPIVEIPLNSYGKLDVAGAVGKDGNLVVMRDLGLKEPYIGYSPIVSGEIAEDITNYYAVSEQTPTVCGLGVLVNPDLSVQKAGGFLVRLLPGADDGDIDILERNVLKIPPVTVLLSEGKSPADIALMLLDGMDAEIASELPASYICECSRERVEKALISLGPDDLEEMASEREETSVECHFCDKKYIFSSEEILLLAQRKASPANG